MADDIDIQHHMKGLIDGEHGLRSRLGEGEITVEERCGGGARFVVRLPMAHPEMTAPAH